MRSPPLLPLLVLLAAGCGPFQNPLPIVNQNRTLAELQYQEVLDNLAVLEARNLRDLLGPAPPTDGPPPPLALRHTFLCRKLPEVVAAADTADPRAAGCPPDPERAVLLEMAYEKAIGFRFDIPVEEAFAAFFEPRPRLYGALRPGWFEVGPATAVPPGVSYVGRAGNTAVWVFPTHLGAFAEFVFALEYIATAPPGRWPGPYPAAGRNPRPSVTLTGGAEPATVKPTGDAPR